MMPPGGIDPKKMEQMMRQMGIKSRKIDAKKVTIETNDGNYVISEPEVIEIDMRGQKSLQISGNMAFEEMIREEDVRIVMEQTGCTEQKAREVLQKAKGNIAEAILLLKPDSV